MLYQQKRNKTLDRMGKQWYTKLDVIRRNLSVDAESKYEAKESCLLDYLCQSTVLLKCSKVYFIGFAVCYPSLLPRKRCAFFGIR